MSTMADRLRARMAAIPGMTVVSDATLLCQQCLRELVRGASQTAVRFAPEPCPTCQTNPQTTAEERSHG